MTFPDPGLHLRHVGSGQVAAQRAGLRSAQAARPEDVRYLRLAGEALQDQIEDVLDVWYGFVAAHPHLVHYFSGADGKPNSAEEIEKVHRAWFKSVVLQVVLWNVPYKLRGMV